MQKKIVKRTGNKMGSETKNTVQQAPGYGMIGIRNSRGWLSETEGNMLRQASQKIPVTALYARLSKDDE